MDARIAYGQCGVRGDGRELIKRSGQRGLVAALVFLVACQSSPGTDRPNSRGNVPSQGIAIATSASLQKIFDGPPDEYMQLLSACLRNAGWSAEPNETGDGIIFNFGSEDQRGAFMQSQADCQAEIGILPPPKPLSDEEIRVRYDFLLTVRDCLVGLGYAIGAPPTEDAFLDGWKVNNPWTPYNDIGGVPEQVWLDINQKCPQVPKSN